MNREMNIPLATLCMTTAVVLMSCGSSDSIENTRSPRASTETSFPDSSHADPEAISLRIDEVCRRINLGESDSVYESATAPRFRQVASRVAFRSHCERLQSRLGALKSKQLSRLDVDPAAGMLVASASYRATFEHGAGAIFVVFEQVGGDWLLLRLKVDAPELLDDPTQYREELEIFAESSDPVLPGTMVDVFDSSEDPPKLLIGSVRVLNVRWKIPGPSSVPAFPASGFVTLSLTREQAGAIENAKNVSVREQPGDASNAQRTEPL